MRDLFDILYAPNRFERDRWAVEPDFDDIFEWESDDPRPEDEDDLDLDEWLAGK
jgi:hypothetical protein